MNIDTIIQTRNELEKKLRIALSTMERKDTINEIYKEILNNQKSCPHDSTKYNWTIADGKCPYCGYEFPRRSEN